MSGRLLQVRFSVPEDHRARAEFGGRGQEPPRLPDHLVQRHKREREDLAQEQDSMRDASLKSNPSSAPQSVRYFPQLSSTSHSLAYRPQIPPLQRLPIAPIYLLQLYQLLPVARLLPQPQAISRFRYHKSCDPGNCHSSRHIMLHVSDAGNCACQNDQNTCIKPKAGLDILRGVLFSGVIQKDLF
jgi:hypothetical protein